MIVVVVVVVSCPVSSYLVLSSLSCRRVSYLVVCLRLVLSCLVLSCLVLSRFVFSFVTTNVWPASWGLNINDISKHQMKKARALYPLCFVHKNLVLQEDVINIVS